MAEFICGIVVIYVLFTYRNLIGAYKQPLEDGMERYIMEQQPENSRRNEELQNKIAKLDKIVTIEDVKRTLQEKMNKSA